VWQKSGIGTENEQFLQFLRNDLLGNSYELNIFINLTIIGPNLLEIVVGIGTCQKQKVGSLGQKRTVDFQARKIGY